MFLKNPKVSYQNRPLLGRTMHYFTNLKSCWLKSVACWTFMTKKNLWPSSMYHFWYWWLASFVAAEVGRTWLGCDVINTSNDISDASSLLARPLRSRQKWLVCIPLSNFEKNKNKQQQLMTTNCLISDHPYNIPSFSLIVIFTYPRLDHNSRTVWRG